MSLEYFISAAYSWRANHPQGGERVFDSRYLTCEYCLRWRRKESEKIKYRRENRKSIERTQEEGRWRNIRKYI